MNRMYIYLIRQSFINKTACRWLSGTAHMKTVDKSIIESLERLALVDFSTEAGIARLEKSIQFADNLMEVDTSSVEPLISTIYEKNENVRTVTVIEKSNREELMKIAPVSEEFYYVAPLGTFSRKQEDSSS